MSDSHMRQAFTALSEITPTAGTVTSIDDLLRLVTERAAKLVGVERCSIYMREERANLFRGCVGCSKGSPLPDDFKRWVAGVPADGVTREVLETRRPVVVANARSDERMVKSTVRHWQIRSLLEVPMTVDGVVIGLLLMDDVDTQHEFHEDEVELARSFADLAGGLIAQTQTRLELQSKLGAASRQLNALRRATAVDERLSDLVLEGRSLSELTATLAELLGKPCALFLPDGERVAAALPDAAPTSALPRLLDPEVAALPEIRQALADNEGSRAFVVAPVPAAGLLHRHVVAGVQLGDELWGRLVVMEHKTRFTGGDVVAGEARRRAPRRRLRLPLGGRVRRARFPGGRRRLRARGGRPHRPRHRPRGWGRGAGRGAARCRRPRLRAGRTRPLRGGACLARRQRPADRRRLRRARRAGGLPGLAP
jgi:hypothetical protein